MFDVADHPAQVEQELLLLPPSTFCLSGVAVASLHDERVLSQPFVALPKVDTCSFIQPYQDAAGLVVETGIGEISDGLLLHGGIDVDPFKVFSRHILLAFCRFDGYAQ